MDKGYFVILSEDSFDESKWRITNILLNLK